MSSAKFEPLAGDFVDEVMPAGARAVSFTYRDPDGDAINVFPSARSSERDEVIVVVVEAPVTGPDTEAIGIHIRLDDAVEFMAKLLTLVSEVRDGS